MLIPNSLSLPPPPPSLPAPPQPPGAVVTESQTFKKRSDFQSNDDYAVYMREHIQVRAPHSPSLGQDVARDW